MTNHAQTKPETAPRELTAAEMRQAGGGFHAHLSLNYSKIEYRVLSR